MRRASFRYYGARAPGSACRLSPRSIAFLVDDHYWGERTSRETSSIRIGWPSTANWPHGKRARDPTHGHQAADRGRLLPLTDRGTAWHRLPPSASPLLDIGVEKETGGRNRPSRVGGTTSNTSPWASYSWLAACPLWVTPQPCIDGAQRPPPRLLVGHRRQSCGHQPVRGRNRRLVPTGRPHRCVLPPPQRNRRAQHQERGRHVGWTAIGGRTTCSRGLLASDQTPRHRL